MLSFLFDLLADIFGGGDAKTRRLRALRRKLVRYLGNAPASAFTGSDPRHLGPSGEITRPARAQLVSIAKRVDGDEVREWEDLCARLLDVAERELPGLVVQLPPDEPRMVYAGDKQL